MLLRLLISETENSMFKYHGNTEVIDKILLKHRIQWWNIAETQNPMIEYPWNTEFYNNVSQKHRNTMLFCLRNTEFSDSVSQKYGIKLCQW